MNNPPMLVMKIVVPSSNSPHLANEMRPTHHACEFDGTREHARAIMTRVRRAAHAYGVSLEFTTMTRRSDILTWAMDNNARVMLDTPRVPEHAPRSEAEYGVVCNVVEPDSCLRLNARCLVMFPYSGWENIKVTGLSRGGRRLMGGKVTAIHRFSNFRAAWLPPYQRDQACPCGTREEMERNARELQEKSDAERSAHPNRRSQLLV